MRGEVPNDALLRQFLLGNVGDEERQRIESLSASDSATRERMLSAEQDLIEDYLEDSLSGDDKERFALRYAKTPAQQRKLRITKTIKDWAITEAASAETSAATAISQTNEATDTDVDQGKSSSISLLGRLVQSLRLRAVFVVPSVAVIILVVVLTILWLNRTAEQQRHLALEREVAQLNDPSSQRNISPQPGALELTPLTLRSGESQSNLRLRRDLPFVELRLRWIQKERYQTYQAVVRRIGDDQAITIPALQPEDDGKVIRLLLPVNSLTPGTYRIHVTGPSGSDDFAEEYQFSLVE